MAMVAARIKFEAVKQHAERVKRIGWQLLEE